MSHHPNTSAALVPPRPLPVLWQLTRGQRPVLLVTVALSLLSAVAAIAQPRLVQSVVDALTASESPRSAITLLVGVTVLAVIVSGVQSYLMQRSAETVVRTLRERLVRKLLAMGVRHHDESNSADLLSRAVADTNLVKVLISAGVVPILGAALTLVGTTVFMLLLDPTLFLITVLAVVLGVVIVLLVGRSARSSSSAVQRNLGAFSVAIERLLASIRTIKAFNAEPMEAANIDRENRRLWASGVRLARLQALVQPAMNLCVQGALVVVILVGAVRVATGELTLGALLAYILYMFMMIMPISSLTQSYTQIQIGLAAVLRIVEIESLSDEDHRRSDEGSDEEAPLLSFEAVGFGYEAGQDTLTDVSLTVLPGQHIALVGRSGAGKSTVLELVERFYEPDRGIIRLHGQDCTTMPLADYRGHFSYVSQDPDVLTGTLRENLAMGRADLSDDRLLSVLREVEMAELVGKATFGLDTELGQSGITLSGGQRQRLAWARVLLSDAEVVLMDEPTSSLDPITERVMQRILRRHLAAKTLITVSHHIASVRRADQIVVLEGGRVVACGRHGELLGSSSLYRDLATDDEDVPAAVA
ncbi:MAG: ABC transporter ATP-binding protein [Propionibacteriaceae bacterium]